MVLNMVGGSLLIILTRGIFRETSLSSLDVSFWRYLMATPTLWVLIFTALSRAAPPTPGQRPTRTSTTPDRRALIVLGILYASVSVSATLAVEYLIAGLFGILYFSSYPTMVALLSLALGERLPRMFWLVLLGTILGIALVLSPRLLGAEVVEGSVIGVVLALLSAFLYACYFQLSRRILRDTMEVSRAVAWTFVGALLTLAALAVFTGLRLPDGRDITFLLGIMLFGTVLPIVACALGIQHLGAPRAALMSMATPFITVVLAVLLLNEFLTVPQLIGGTLILASMIVLARDKQTEGQMT